MIKDNIMKITDIEDFDSNNLDTLLHKMLHYIRITTNCEAGFIYLKKDNYLHFSIFQNDSFSYEKIYKLQKNIKFPIEENTNTLLIESYLQSKIIMIDDIYQDTNYNFTVFKDFDRSFDYKSRSILTAPLIDTPNQETIGVVQIINKKEKNKNIPFTQKDKDFMSLSSYFIALSIINEKDNLLNIKRYNLKIKKRTQELIETQERLKEQAYKDPLTNLYNRRYFNPSLPSISTKPFI